MKRRTGIPFCVFFIIALALLSSFSKEPSYGFSTEVINKKVCEYGLGSIDQTTPLGLFLTNMYAQAEGKSELFASISTVKFQLDKDEVDLPVSIEKKEKLNNMLILETVVYRDSVAAVVSKDVSGLILLNFTWIENGKWVNGGQGMAPSEKDLDRVLREYLPIHYYNLSRIRSVSSYPSDISPFVAFLHNQSESPESFILHQLGSHKLVINGEVHRRRVNWEMLKRLINNPEFAKVCGTIFMELPSWRQAEMDEFLSSQDLRPEYILEIFRDEQINGWWDKGEYEFICDVWRHNRSVPPCERISIILADWQVPFSAINSSLDAKEALENAEQRDTHMADVIGEYIARGADSRNCLFLVGYSHAADNDRISAAFSSPGHNSEVFSAGTQLKQRLGDSAVFSIFQHTYSSDNAGKHRSLLRGGVFDEAFAANGDLPVGFALEDSPFGKEPFDAGYEQKHNSNGGSYQDNFDGYLFLHSLADEPQNGPLYEIFSDGFILEMKRRADCFGWEDRTDIWFGQKSSEMTQEAIINHLL